MTSAEIKTWSKSIYDVYTNARDDIDAMRYVPRETQTLLASLEAAYQTALLNEAIADGKVVVFNAPEGRKFR